MFYKFEFTPTLDCKILAASYNTKARQLLNDKKIASTNDIYSNRRTNITGEIFELCQLDFTNEKEFKEYASQSPLQHLLNDVEHSE